MIFVSFTTFQETFAPLVLKRRAEKLRRESGNQQYHTADEHLDSNKSLFMLLSRTVSRPLRLLAFHPIIQVSSIISAFYYGLLYIVLSNFSSLWTSQYHESPEIGGLHYIACALGEIAASQIGGPLMDRFFSWMQARNGGMHVPEFRIPLVFLGAFVAPFGFLVFAWTAQYRVHWIAVDIGIFLALFGMQIAGMPMQAYVIDVYPDHTSSAMAASQFLKSMTAFLFPLFAPSMFAKLGYGWGGSTLAFGVLLFGVPAPLILWRYGARLRAKATSSY